MFDVHVLPVARGDVVRFLVEIRRLTEVFERAEGSFAVI